MSTRSRKTRDSNPAKQLARLIADAGGSPIHSEELARAWKDVLYPELELRVGTKLSRDLSEAQLIEFEALIDAGDDIGSTAWLGSNVPDYRRIAEAELKTLMTEATAWFISEAESRATEVNTNV